MFCVVPLWVFPSTEILKRARVELPLLTRWTLFLCNLVHRNWPVYAGLVLLAVGLSGWYATNGSRARPLLIVLVIFTAIFSYLMIMGIYMQVAPYSGK